MSVGMAVGMSVGMSVGMAVGMSMCVSVGVSMCVSVGMYVRVSVAVGMAGRSGARGCLEMLSLCCISHILFDSRGRRIILHATYLAATLHLLGVPVLFVPL